MPFLRLLLIDAHQGFRESARKYLLRCPGFSSVEIADSYSEGMLLSKQYEYDLLLVDREILFGNPVLIKEIEKLKQDNPSIDVLVLFLFQEEDINRCQELFPLVSGIILKESFAEDLYEYLSAEKNDHVESQDSSRKGVDQCY